jgi:disulfide oxidoreductase YuzD
MAPHQGYEYREHLSEPLARRVHDDDRFECMLVATGEVTASSNTPISDVYRRKRKMKITQSSLV